MAKSKRNPRVGKHWLAWHALEGDEDLEFVREYVAHARLFVGGLSAKHASHSDRDTAKEISGLHLFLIALEMAMAEEGPSTFKVEIKRRKPGKPINTLDRAKAGHSAAALVEKAVATGIKQEAAVAEAVERTRLSRSEIFIWLRKRRRDREAWAKQDAEDQAARLAAGLPPLKQSG